MRSAPNTNEHSDKPVYLWIYNRLKELILNKTLKVGEKLPHRKMAEAFHVSKMPVAEAFNMLEAEGFITTVPHVGTVVSNNAWAALQNNKPSVWQAYISSGKYKVPPSTLINAVKKLETSNHIMTNKIAPAFKPETPLIRAIESVKERLLAHDSYLEFDYCGTARLKRTLASHLERIGIKTTTDNIIITQGAGESLAMIVWAFMGAGMNLIYEAPSFINSIMLFQSAGVNMEGVPMDEDGVNIEKLNAKLNRTKNGIFYTHPINHDPTGVHTSESKRNAILAMCNKFGIPIIENGTLRDFVFDREYPKPIKAFDRNEQVIYFGSLWSDFTGFKISWIVAPEFLTEKLKFARMSSELTSNTLAEMIADEMLSKGYYYEYMESLKPVITAQYYEIQRLMDKYLSDIATWRRNAPSYFIYVKFNKNIDVVKLHQAVQDNLLFSGNMFDPCDTCHARINTIGVQPDQLEAWIKRVRDMVTAPPHTKTTYCACVSGILP